MLHKTVQQFLGGVEWGELDYLLVDLPPGTGDVQLSLCQIIPITGAVIVSTPQDVALNVAHKAIAMFKKLNAPLLGIIENMSHYTCPHCGKREDIFGSGGAKKTAERLGIPFLGEIPLETKIRAASDIGRPLVLSDPGSAAARAFTTVAENLAAQVSIRAMQGELASQVKVTF
jgi:ATP-binding protein involved in chromosome partitioning